MPRGRHCPHSVHTIPKEFRNIRHCPTCGKCVNDSIPLNPDCSDLHIRGTNESKHACCTNCGRRIIYVRK